jgi:Flp pilus assembly protein TadB
MMRAMTETAGDGSPGSGGAAGGAPRPGRAELRRAAEAQAAVSQNASASRLERRRQAELQSKQQKTRGALWRAWWLYPLVALIGVCVYLGFQSVGDAPAPTPQVSTITEEP